MARKENHAAELSKDAAKTSAGLRGAKTPAGPRGAAEASGGPRGAAKTTRRSRTHRDGTRSDDFRSDIVRAAAKLFGEEGYAGTTMSAIARAVGIDQSSLYYWFSSKDDILNAVIDLSNDTADFAGPERADFSSAAFLYALSYRDTLNLCQMPVDYSELEMAANKDRKKFAHFFESYEHLAEVAHDAIRDGAEKGELISDDPWMSALSLLVMGEGIQHRYHRMLQGDDPFRTRLGLTRQPADYAHLAARNSLAMLLHDLADIDVARADAERAGWLS
jgi:TetR/AcrR family transcriptional regulator